ncbi:hypothetical protein [Halobacillus amylolyticus]|uniref:DUF4871 domain-containing protein n=1 Tax=Halobacillus amylolyticus TaxID=2932259 RepID=A0ABY4HEK3_9BACI|nr:hypothetical protein [Halobacillus amylolyticus]UOR13221.1 hypothetical protein MUO15_06960 [Halobacillus amylolyticus]
MSKSLLYLIIPFSIFLLTSCSNASTSEESPVEASYFETENYTMLGEEGKVGFILGQNEDLVANNTKKYMWHLWGNEEFENKDFEVKGINLDNSDEKTLVTSPIAGPNNGADAHIPSNMTFPSEGTWELDILVGGELFYKMTVEIL